MSFSRYCVCLSVISSQKREVTISAVLIRRSTVPQHICHFSSQTCLQMTTGICHCSKLAPSPTWKQQQNV